MGKIYDTALKTGLVARKTASKKLINKTAEATREFMGSKIVEKIAKPKPVSYEFERCSPEK